jgi:1L-myo-inositol 1-phosphate cytidylyltransferase / CDP-L-myo-inositol myo-inositolphosphotransferase
MASTEEVSGLHSAAERLGPPVRPRRAVILAAGRSERMRALTAGGSKAHLRLGGVSLVERAAGRLLAAGITDILVVVGARSRSVGRLVDRIAPGRVRPVFAERWMDGNGASLAAVERELVDDPLFAVMVADHVFSDGAIDELLAATRAAALVDDHPTMAIWSEGTRVRVQGGRVLEFSKELEERAVDCGAFVLTPAIFEAQRRAAAEGDASLSGALCRFAEQHPIAALPLPPRAWWHDLDTPEDVRAARRSLRRSLGSPSDGPVARYLNRPISTRISIAASRLRPSPNAISVVALLVCAIGGSLFAVGRGAAGGVLVQLGSIVDGVDGELARIQYRTSRWGALLDGVLDRIGDAIAVAGLAIWAVRDGSVGETAGIVLVGVALTGSLLSMATKDRVRALGMSDASEERLRLLFGGRDARLLVIAIAGVAGRPVLGLVVIIVTTWLSLVGRLVSVARRSDAPA